MLVPKQLIDKDQTWFWTEAWQAAEREAEDDLRAGQVKEFDTLDELIADLDADEAEREAFVFRVRPSLGWSRMLKKLLNFFLI